MRKRTFLTVAFAVVCTVSFLFTSCENSDSDPNFQADNGIDDVEIQSTEDDAMVESLYSSVDGEVDEVVVNLDNSGYQASMMKSAEEEIYICKTVSVDHPDSVRFPKVITIDYGEGCSKVINGDTITKSGVIKVTITDRWFVEGAMRTVEFVDYYVNGVKIEGTRSVTNKGKNDDGNMEFEIKLRNGKVTFNDTLQYTREATKTREWERAQNPKDDVWYVSGECSGTNLDGYNYSHEITSKLMIIRCAEFRYQWIIVSGEVELTRNGKQANLNYGDGTCDDTAILTINGETKEIKVRKRYKIKRKFFARK